MGMAAALFAATGKKAEEAASAAAAGEGGGAQTETPGDKEDVQSKEDGEHPPQSLHEGSKQDEEELDADGSQEMLETEENEI